jgi:hypothetical protein
MKLGRNNYYFLSLTVIAQVAWGAAPGRLRRYDSGDGAGVAAVNMSQPMDDSAA